MIQDGSKVGIEYTLKVEEGDVVDTSEGRGPLVYQQGAGQILPALEQELEGMPVGAEKQIELSPEQGYGPVSEELFHPVPVEQVPEEARHEGARLMTRDGDGGERILRVHEVRDDTVVLDLNHPLAGRTLQFEVKVVSID